MKCFVTDSTPTPDGLLKPGIRVQLDPYPHIQVGEEGRGRTLVRMPVTLEIATINPAETDPNGGQVTLLTDARVMRSSESRTIIARAGEFQDARALVLFSYYSGFRGHSTWEVHAIDDSWLPFPYLSRNATEPIDIGPLVTLIASGTRAEGDAGRMGKSEEHLCVIKAGTLVRFTRDGRTYGGPKILLFLWDGKDFAVTTPGDLAAKQAQQLLEKNPQKFTEI